jgi:hypothetical protein
VLLNELLRVPLLGIVAAKVHLDLGCLKVGCVLRAKLLGELDVLLVA